MDTSLYMYTLDMWDVLEFITYKTKHHLRNKDHQMGYKLRYKILKQTQTTLRLR